MKLLLKERAVDVFKITADCPHNYSFIPLDSGRVVNSKITPVLNHGMGFEKDQYLIQITPSFNIVVNEFQLNLLTEEVSAEIDVSSIEDAITEVEFLETGPLTVCIISLGKEMRFLGQFSACTQLELSTIEKQNAAYSHALTKLIDYKSQCKCERVQGLSDERV